MEREREMKNREERKMNVIIRGVEIRKEGWEVLREVAEEIVKETGVEAKIEKIKRLDRGNEEGRDMLWVKFARLHGGKDQSNEGKEEFER